MIFSLNIWHCQDENLSLKEFCQLHLWHDKVIGNDIPKGVNRIWISKGHALKYHHPNGAYTIFLVEQSGSMASNSITPLRGDIKQKLDNNML